MSNQNIQITSENLYLSSSVNSISMSANQDLTIYAGKGIVYTTGVLGSVDPLNSFTVNSQNIILGYPKDLTITKEKAVKADQLINVLSQILSLMKETIKNPNVSDTTVGKIEILEKELNKIKSETTELY